MERQYIGARYVPKFSDPIEWLEGKSYEPLTIVTYMGASYTSKKAVPAGVKPTDNSYWVVTGNYNAQVEEYRQQTVGLRGEYDKRFNRKWLFLGDSYDPYSGWISKLVGMMGLANNEYWNIAVSGHCFHLDSWLNDIKAWVNSNPGEVKNIGHIVIGGGLNDSVQWAYADLAADIQRFGEYCKATFDEAVVQLAYFGWEIDGVESSHGSTPQWRAGAQWQYSRCAAHGMEYLSGCESAVHGRYLIGADGVHPNEQGGWQIAVAMCNAIKTGCATTSYPLNSGTFTPVSGTGSGTIYQSLNNNTVFTDLDIRVENPDLTFVGGQNVEIGELILPHSNTIPTTDVLSLVKLQDGTFKEAPFRVAVMNDKLVLNYRGLSEDGRAFGTITPVSFGVNIESTHSALTD